MLREAIEGIVEEERKGKRRMQALNCIKQRKIICLDKTESTKSGLIMRCRFHWRTWSFQQNIGSDDDNSQFQIISRYESVSVTDLWTLRGFIQPKVYQILSKVIPRSVINLSQHLRSECKFLKWPFRTPWYPSTDAKLRTPDLTPPIGFPDDIV